MMKRWKAMKKVSDKIIDGYGWKSLSDTKRIEYVKIISRSVLNSSEKSDKEMDCIVDIFAAYVAGRVNHFYFNPDDEEIRDKILKIKFLIAIMISVREIMNEIKNSKKL